MSDSKFHVLKDKDPIIYQLEQSLIQVLSSKKEVQDRITDGPRRVRALTIKIIPEIKDPKFLVQIGMFETQFSASTGLKEKGSCFGLEKYIRDWFLRPSVTELIKNYVYAHRNDNFKKNNG